MPWKNGLGQTIELLREDLPERQEFGWRLSMADVTEDSEFSIFSGYDRTLLLLEGAGVTLSHGDGRSDYLDSPLQAAMFAGEEHTVATLHQGPIRDFNVMTRRGYCESAVFSSAGPGSLSIEDGADVLLIYAVKEKPQIRLSTGNALELQAGHLLVARAPKLTGTCSGGSWICVRIQYLNSG